MKQGWEYKTLGEVCSSINGLWKGKKEPFVNVGVIRNANFTKQFTLDFSNIEYLEVEERQYKTRKLLKGDLIIEKSGGSDKWPVGRPVLFEKEVGEFSFSNFTSVLRINNFEILCPKYLHYFLVFGYFRGDTQKLQSNTTGLHNLDFKTYLSIPIPVPPLPEQQSIVARLDSAFAKIDALKANAQKQLENAKALFQNALKDAMTPKDGWEEKKLGEVCGKIGSGATPLGGKNVYIESGCSLIRSMNVQYNEFKYEELAHISDSASEQLKNVEIKENDVLFNITGASIARCCIVPKNILPARVNQHVSILRIVNSVLPKFLCFTLNSEPHQKELIGIGEAGSTRQALTKGDLSKHLIKYPSITEQQAIVSRLDAISSRCRQLEENYTKTIALCDDMKQALLRETFE